ncbi:hypothetical protein NX784_16080 [Massilia pinisoli]|uniref:Uncharacterized protein n=1 Tax=Massilia pinisoli TaxID=1772194 RepID=A0ABT1ZT88_9BURK|nr:hypothetical protein [Massilia pinisoli]MCS0583109.1 hypothetical protein [Massilia pinisoli]
MPEDMYEGEVPAHKVGYYTDLRADRATGCIGQQDRKVQADHYHADGTD